MYPALVHVILSVCVPAALTIFEWVYVTAPSVMLNDVLGSSLMLMLHVAPVIRAPDVAFM